MQRSSLSLFLAIVAVGVSAFAITRGRLATAADTGRASEDYDAISSRLDDAMERIRKLTDAAEERGGSLQVDASELRNTREAADSQALTALRKQITSLDKRLRVLEKGANEDKRGRAERQRQTARGERALEASIREDPSGAALEKVRAQAMVNAGDAEQRLAALRALRGVNGGRNEAVVASMIQLARTSQDGEVRADIWRQMSGARDAQLIAPMIQALRNDSHVSAREEAAETLGDFRDRPDVRAALEYASKHDKDEGVRDQSLRSLGRGRRR